MKKLLVGLFLLCLSGLVVGCGTNNSLSPNETEITTNKNSKNLQPSLAGIHGDSKERVIEVLGRNYQETYHEEAGHFPETYYLWEYPNGITVTLGKNSAEVLEIRATSSEAQTNLGIKPGDQAKRVFETYRPNYLEPESIHGGQLIGWFKTEEGTVTAFDFNIDDGLANFGNIDANSEVERIILTYPAHVDDSF